MKKTKWTDMAGTEGTHQYKVILRTRYGTLGIRDIGNAVRIRVEPTKDAWMVTKIAAMLSRGAGWKQPGDGDQYRFSLVVRKGASNPTIGAALSAAKLALGVGRLKSVQNPAANKVAKQLVA